MLAVKRRLILSSNSIEMSISYQPGFRQNTVRDNHLVFTWHWSIDRTPTREQEREGRTLLEAMLMFWNDSECVTL
jgi:hypothetical protein